MQVSLGPLNLIPAPLERPFDGLAGLGAPSPATVAMADAAAAGAGYTAETAPQPATSWWRFLPSLPTILLLAGMYAGYKRAKRR